MCACLYECTDMNTGNMVNDYFLYYHNLGLTFNKDLRVFSIILIWLERKSYYYLKRAKTNSLFGLN